MNAGLPMRFADPQVVSHGRSVLRLKERNGSVSIRNQNLNLNQTLKTMKINRLFNSIFRLCCGDATAPDEAKRIELRKKRKKKSK